MGWPFQPSRDEVQTLGGEQTPEGLGMEEWGRRWPQSGTRPAQPGEQMRSIWLSSDLRRGEETSRGSISLLGSGAGVFTEPQSQLQGFANEG